MPKGRFTFCCQQCVDEALVGASATWARDACWKRDKGICAACGCDSNSAYKAWRATATECHRLESWFANREMRGQIDWKEFKRSRETLRKRISPPNPGWTPGRQSGWDADHILQVVRGGGSCGIENLRTLCHPCHKRATAKLAAERAAERNPHRAAQMTLPGLAAFGG